jgi:hypothetical protein
VLRPPLLDEPAEELLALELVDPPALEAPVDPTPELVEVLALAPPVDRVELPVVVEDGLPLEPDVPPLEAPAEPELVAVPHWQTP